MPQGVGKFVVASALRLRQEGRTIDPPASGRRLHQDCRTSAGAAEYQVALKQPPRAGVIMNDESVGHMRMLATVAGPAASLRSLEAATTRPDVEVGA